MRPIWFFVGLILFVMGGIIFLSGIYNLINPPAVKTILAGTHPDIWWGGVMIIFGGIMYLKTRKTTV
jgi:divalent metal cation (Fe/Co/Zn/Cd) transporter